MGKAKKEHRKKVAKRNAMIGNEKKKMQKMQQDFLMQLIEREKAAGKFENPVSVNDTDVLGSTAPILTERGGPIL